jgi:endoglucanase
VVFVAAILSAGLLTAPAVAQPPELIVNGSFDSGTEPWWSSGTTAAVVDGRLCADIPGGTINPWDAIIGQNDLELQAGESYELSFDASASRPVGVLAKVQLQVEPWSERLSRPVTLGPESTHFTHTFTSTVDSAVEQVAFQVGGAAEPWTLCLDNVSLVGGAEPPVYVPDTGPRVRVNQVGYLPDAPKGATIVTEATEPMPWQVADASGVVVASGDTAPRGVDAASGQRVHTVDFSDVTTPGTGYTLSADGEVSHPFEIGSVYEALRSDALQFFYLQRSGIAIDGDLVGAEYARPAGHVGVAPNQGDTDVPCQPGVCDYRLDVRGGWYDAGDHGKYVVNGGIATYQLLSTFERTKTAPTATPGALEDGTLRVPERDNGVPDILDEARWELEFLLRMQVPAGQPLAGMAHHKIHDRAWTGLPLAPEDDPQPRELHPPSTAATLNLAATAAQCGRLYAPYDAAFAGQCLSAARTAYAAAKANPNLLADPNDGTGGGAYSDDDVSDEFYWAAAELYLTTGEQTFLTDLRSSPHHAGGVFESNGFSWAATAALGRLDLATVPSGLPVAERDQLRQSVVSAAESFLAIAEAEAYGLPLPGDGGGYVWGSNSNIINNLVVLATAFDLTGDRKYRDGALAGADYLFGRNALNHSYVTGWGERSPQNQHSRIFARQLDPNSPTPPVGSIAGGPNEALQDPFVESLLAGCAPQFCYVDDIQSYSTNEVAINWNSALAWFASFAADQAAPAPAAACEVRYEAQGRWPNGFIAQVTFVNTGQTTVRDWELSWSFPTDQRVARAWGAELEQQGAAVTARPAEWTRRVAPGQQVTFGFLGTGSLAGPAPELFRLNGAPCGR